MLKHPYFFFILNFFITLSLLMFGGYKFSFVAMIIVAIIILSSNYKLIGFCNSISLIIVYMLIFDSSFFSMTSYNIRLWYLLEFPLLVYYLIKNFGLKKKYNSIYLITLFILLSMMVLYFILDPFNGKLSIIKYLLFSIGLIYVLYNSFVSILKKINIRYLLQYFCSIGLFVAFWGILQYLMVRFPNIHYKIMYDYYNVHPSAFFSETTWYSEYIFFTAVILIYFYFTIDRLRYLILSLPCFLGILISTTRNTFVAMAFWFILEIIFLFISGKVNKKLLKCFFILLLVIPLCLYKIGISKLSLVSKVIERFLNGDSGRMQAFQKSFVMIKEAPLLGHGFSFNPLVDVAGHGTYIGAKSFNLFLMIMHTVGVEGFLFFLFLLFGLYLKLFNQFYLYRRNDTKIAIVFLTCFLSISMFAPIHQFPFGMFIISVVLAIEKNKKNCLLV